MGQQALQPQRQPHNSGYAARPVPPASPSPRAPGEKSKRGAASNPSSSNAQLNTRPAPETVSQHTEIVKLATHWLRQVLPYPAQLPCPWDHIFGRCDPPVPPRGNASPCPHCTAARASGMRPAFPASVAVKVKAAATAAARARMRPSF